MGALGFTLSKDLARWMRPLSILVLIAVGVSIVMLVLGAGGSPILSLVIYGLSDGLSAALILVDFNFLRWRAGANDVVWLATGIFVSIVNIFSLAAESVLVGLGERRAAAAGRAGREGGPPAVAPAYGRPPAFA